MTQTDVSRAWGGTVPLVDEDACLTTVKEMKLRDAEGWRDRNRDLSAGGALFGANVRTRFEGISIDLSCLPMCMSAHRYFQPFTSVTL